MIKQGRRKRTDMQFNIGTKMVHSDQLGELSLCGLTKINLHPPKDTGSMPWALLCVNIPSKSARASKGRNARTYVHAHVRILIVLIIWNHSCWAGLLMHLWLSIIFTFSFICLLMT